jgi:hypothetical protein
LGKPLIKEKNRLNYDILKWLQNWFFQNCDGKWEKEQRLLIETIDNPGWLLTLQLKNSINDNKAIEELSIERTEQNWCQSHIKKNEFVAVGGPFNLTEILYYFRNFIEDNVKLTSSYFVENEILEWMQNWYYNHCDEDWEHTERFRIKTTETGWYFSFYLEDTFYKNNFSPIEVKKSQNDWYKCYLAEYSFIGMGGIFNLIDILKTFKQWAEKQQSNF